MGATEVRPRGIRVDVVREQEAARREPVPSVVKLEPAPVGVRAVVGEEQVGPVLGAQDVGEALLGVAEDEGPAMTERERNERAHGHRTEPAGPTHTTR